MVIKVGLIVTLVNLALYVAFRFFPDSLYFDSTKEASDPTRYEKKYGWFTNFSWTNLTDAQWKHALALGPGIYRNAVVASAITFLIIQLLLPAPHKFFLGIFLIFYFGFPTFYLVRQARKYKI